MHRIWYKDWFNTQQYLDLYKHRNDSDAKKIITLLLKNIHLPKGSECLDLACGNGRHSLLFAKKGYHVTGIDLSPYLIKQAQQRLHKEYKAYSGNLNFIIRDMRKIEYKNKFDLVVNLFSSFGYFDSDTENFKVLKGVSRALKHGGYFLFDFLNKEHLTRNIVPFDLKILNMTAYLQLRHIENSFVVKNIFIIQSSHKYKAPKIHHYFEKIRLYSLVDLRNEFKKNRLKVIKVFGDYEGKPYFKTKSERLIILARKVNSERSRSVNS
ncbi:MAG TPA: class I SAM-dependent methyltransferase [Ignavibacteria bacterium]|jgi:SAM-dependent methyltransferase